MHETEKTAQAGSGLGFILIVGILALLAGGFVWRFMQGPAQAPQPMPIETRQATLLPQLKTLPSFALHDQADQIFDNQRLLGKWTFLNFGYTSCPDVCPTTLAMLASMHHALQERGFSEPYQIVFVSIDPERDSSAQLEKYLRFFDPAFLGATGDQAALQQLTQPLGILYAKVETDNSAMGYVMDHTASVLLIDPAGRYHALFTPPHQADVMLEDFLKIVDNEPAGH